MLEHYAQGIAKWTPKINLVASSQLPDLWTRHILDSYQIAEHLPDQAEAITDLGSGGGLPGLVIAIHAKVHHPKRRITLVESDQRKSVFLRTMIGDLDLPATVQAKRIEDVQLPKADVVTARALASLDRLLELSHPLLKRDGLAVFPKGKSAADELEIARRSWQFACQEVQSLTNIDARILVIRNIERGTSRG